MQPASGAARRRASADRGRVLPLRRAEQADGARGALASERGEVRSASGARGVRRASVQACRAARTAALQIGSAVTSGAGGSGRRAACGSRRVVFGRRRACGRRSSQTVRHRALRAAPHSGELVRVERRRDVPRRTSRRIRSASRVPRCQARNSSRLRRMSSGNRNRWGRVGMTVTDIAMRSGVVSPLIRSVIRARIAAIRDADPAARG